MHPAQSDSLRHIRVTLSLAIAAEVARLYLVYACIEYPVSLPEALVMSILATAMTAAEVVMVVVVQWLCTGVCEGTSSRPVGFFAEAHSDTPLALVVVFVDAAMTRCAWINRVFIALGTVWCMQFAIAGTNTPLRCIGDVATRRVVQLRFFKLEQHVHFMSIGKVVNQNVALEQSP
uniref:Uncharacterized protein n=1 Tax=Anopheles atroparvus TaxID=41427 RepID=A0A182IT78_ANOAO